MQGILTCKVCERDFALIIEKHYIARDVMRIGGVTVALSGQTEAKIYDAFDCPHCGCQNIIQERKFIEFDSEEEK